MSNIKVVNMIMIYDNNDNVLVLDKIHPVWGGLTFPGGKLENGESAIDSSIREVKEETGLDISNLVPCGIVHWAAKNGDRYIEFLYKTSSFKGDICSSTHEGKVYWIKKEELFSSNNLSLNFEHYLPMFFENKYSELYFEWDGTSFDGKPNYL